MWLVSTTGSRRLAIIFPAPGRTQYIKRGYAKSKLETCNSLILFANGARIPSCIRGSLPVTRCMRALLQGEEHRSSKLALSSIARAPPTGVERRRSSFPDDVRNLEAARELDRLAVEIAAREGSKLHAQLDKPFEDEEGGLIAMPIIRENPASGRLLAVV